MDGIVHHKALNADIQTFTGIKLQFSISVCGNRTDEAKVELFAETGTNFFLKVVDAQPRSLKDSSGNVTELIVHQNGKDITGKRVK